MKLSIIIAILNSHEIVRRQYLHFSKMDLPEDVEIIFIDDGSYPPLEPPGIKNFTLHYTNDKRQWTTGIARNTGARVAKGKYFLMTDIDYIIPRDAIEAARNLKEDKMCFRREFGVLDDDGNITQDINILRQWGLAENRIKSRGTKIAPHPNNFVMRKEIFWKLGGYREDRMNEGYPKCTDDGAFKIRWTKLLNSGGATIKDADLRPTLYMFPSGQYCGDVDYNPFGMFHDLTRKTKENYWYANMSR